MTNDNLIKRDEDPGYIIAWKHKYDFETGKITDNELTYGEAKKACEELIAKDTDKTYWPEKVKAAPEWHIIYE